MKKQYENQIKKLVNKLAKNATYLGLSELTIQYMLKSAFESNPGLKLVVNHKVGSKGEVKCNHFDLMPHHPLPNCEHYENKTSELDMLGAIFGKSRRLDKGVRTVWNGENVRANRYVRYIMNQLGHYRDRGQKNYYWRHALILIQSPAFQVMAFNYVCHNWHREMHVDERYKILTEVGELVEDLKIEIKMRRVYIKKANGKWRPLGVPTKAWRVYLHMLNVLVVWFRMGSDPHQHAYKPQQGVHTAWKDLLERIDNPNIYEFDLESFFPSVNLKGMREILSQELGMPDQIAGLLIDLNRSITELKGEDKLPEKSERQVLLNSSGQANPNLPPDIQRLLKEIQSFPSMSESEKEAALKEVLPKGWTVYKETGVPQGSAISCGLATVNLHYIWKTLGDQLLMYADDGLVFPQDSLEVKIEDPDRGIKQNQSKSGWVRREGEWKKSLKFLGLEYIPATEEEPSKIRANTRNGSKKEYTLEDMFLVYLLNERDLLMWLSSNSTEDLTYDTEVANDGNVIFQKDERGKTLLMDLTYNGIKAKSSQGPTSLFKVKKEILSSIEKDMKENVTVLTWLENAAQRFLNLPRPLTQLFETHGLAILSDLYDTRDMGTQIACENRLTCVKGSWTYRMLGSMLYKKFAEFTLSDEALSWINSKRIIFKTESENLKNLIAKGCSNWEALTNHPKKPLLGLWQSNFEMKSNQIKFAPALEKEELMAVIKKEMGAWLRKRTINIQNASTFAVEDLLDSKPFNHKPRKDDWRLKIKFCKRNRVHTMEQTQEALKAKSEKMNRNLRKEFLRQFGKPPENLSVRRLT